MSKSADRAAKLASMDIDDTPSRPVSELLKEPAKTAPGQLMKIQTDLLKAEKKVEELQQKLDTAAPREILLSEIYEVPGRRRLLSPQERAELKENLSKHPLLTPITVRPKNDRGYEIVSGHNRTEIYRELGKESIKAFIQEVEQDKADLYAFYANLLSPSLPDYEKYLGFKKRQGEMMFSQRLLANEAGINESVVSELFCFDDLPPEAHEILSEKPHILGRKAAGKFAKATLAGKSQRVVEALKKLASGDEKFTQSSAVTYIHQTEDIRPAKQAPRVIKEGQVPFCKLETRKNVVTVQFKNESLAAEWIGKFEEFVRAQVKAAQL
jgi:ParB family transcriptional regulator, chromosome partitioning protein